MDAKAQIGDRVRIWWDADSIDGVVNYVPTGPGDSWIIVEDDGGIVHVNLFYGMRVMSRKAE
jgi:hypothetical protein